jgi:hypothetical protein
MLYFSKNLLASASSIFQIGFPNRTGKPLNHIREFSAKPARNYRERSANLARNWREISSVRCNKYRFINMLTYHKNIFSLCREIISSSRLGVIVAQELP